MDLSLLHSNTVFSVDLSGTYQIPYVYYEHSDILDVLDVDVEGKITQKEVDQGQYQDYIDCSIHGDVILEDSISLEKISYPFSFEYHDYVEENWINNENTLDIFEFLWENIVLEVPLQFTKVDDLSKFHGDGWKLIREDEVHNSHHPFNELLNDFEKE